MFYLDAHHLSSGNVVLARFVGGERQTAFTQKRLLICALGAAPWYFRDPRRVASFYLEQG